MSERSERVPQLPSRERGTVSRGLFGQPYLSAKIKLLSDERLVLVLTCKNRTGEAENCSKEYGRWHFKDSKGKAKGLLEERDILRIQQQDRNYPRNRQTTSYETTDD